jgi:hypothetical protein
MTVWNICCPGPSLDWEALGDLEGTILCVNMGLIGAPRADYWCCIDKPNEVHRACVEDFHRLRPTILTKKKRFPHYQAMVGDPELENPYGVPGFAGNWVQKAHTGVSFSAVTATAYVVARGAREIVYHGVDLGGVGYGEELGNPKHEAKKTEKSVVNRIWKKRWVKEKECWKRIWEGSLKAGVELRGLPVVVTGPKASAKQKD